MILLCSLNPYADFAYDGLLLNPMEVVFVKVKRFQQEANWGSARLAAVYSRWMDQEVNIVHSFPCCIMCITFQEQHHHAAQMLQCLLTTRCMADKASHSRPVRLFLNPAP